MAEMAVKPAMAVKADLAKAALAASVAWLTGEEGAPAIVERPANGLPAPPGPAGGAASAAGLAARGAPARRERLGR